MFCQHQKSWVIDAGQPSETSFVGGLNLTSVAMRLHDVYVEVTGPSATDVRHNFVERWNEASERHAPDGNWTCDATRRACLCRPCRRAVRAEHGADPAHARSRRYAEARVERSILEQYQRAIDAARRTIYIQNQAIPMPEVARPLLAAVERGVDVVMLVPAIAEQYVYEARHDPQQAARFWGIEALGRHENFTLAGLAEHHAGTRRAAYVHAKMMLIDDVWATVGSCNLHPFSLAGHTEMNASIWDADVCTRPALPAVRPASRRRHGIARRPRGVTAVPGHRPRQPAQDGEPRAGLAGARLSLCRRKLTPGNPA